MSGIGLTDLPDYPAHLDKGYGETLILERLAAMGAVGAPHLVRCTGRLYVRNARRLDEGVDMLVRLRRSMRFADSRFFACRTALLPVLVHDLKALVDDSAHVYLEHALARCALRADRHLLVAPVHLCPRAARPVLGHGPQVSGAR